MSRKLWKDEKAAADAVIKTKDRYKLAFLIVPAFLALVAFFSGDFRKAVNIWFGDSTSDKLEKIPGVNLGEPKKKYPWDYPD